VTCAGDGLGGEPGGGSGREEFADLIDIDREEFTARYQAVVTRMLDTGVWYRLRGSYKGFLGDVDLSAAEFEELPPPRHVGLGRSDFYDAFLEVLSARFGHPVYQSDYLLWVDPGNPYRSLLYYIETAERIDFNLQGISPENLRQVMRHGRLAEDRRELGTPYMTLWEINRILFSDNVEKTWWHVVPLRSAGAGGIDDVRTQLTGFVDPARIVRYDPPEPLLS
jgi:hypothetical protein